jgi:hypothetical protein
MSVEHASGERHQHLAMPAVRELLRCLLKLALSDCDGNRNNGKSPFPFLTHALGGAIGLRPKTASGHSRPNRPILPSN